MICTSHPYVFVAAQSVDIALHNHAFETNLSQPWYFSCFTHKNISELSLTVIMPMRCHAELWIPVNMTRLWEGESGLSQLSRLLKWTITHPK